MATTKKPKLKVATTTVITSEDGHRVAVHRGDTYPANHKLVKKLKGVFVDPDEWARMTGNTVVEQATAAPGEVRNVKAPEEG